MKKDCLYIALILFPFLMCVGYDTTGFVQAQNGNSGSVRQGVSSLNGKRGALTISGSGVSTSGNTITVAGDAVSSVFGRTGAVAAQSGDYTTAQVTESGNLYFTNGRAQSAIDNTSRVLSGLTITGFNGFVRAASGVISASALVSGDIPDLSATYSPRAGNTSLVTLGTVTAGTWQATPITDTYLATISTAGKVSDSALSANVSLLDAVQSVTGLKTFSGLKITSSQTIGWDNGSGTTDIVLARDGADSLALRRSTNGQALYIYGTYTDSSNYENLQIFANSSGATIRTKALGTGSNRALTFGTAGIARWVIDTSGNLTANADASYDIGAATTTRPRNLFLSGTANLKRPLANKTADYSVLTSDSNSIFTNLSAGGTVNFSLPAAAAGLTYTFYVKNATALTIVANGTNTIRNATTVTAGGGNITTSTVGNQVTLYAISTSEWIVQSITGTWTFN